MGDAAVWIHRQDRGRASADRGVGGPGQAVRAAMLAHEPARRDPPVDDVARPSEVAELRR